MMQPHGSYEHVQSYHMIVVAPDTVEIQPLVKALMAADETTATAVGMTIKGEAEVEHENEDSADHLILQALARTLADKEPSNHQCQRRVHIMEHVKQCPLKLLHKAHHFVVVVPSIDEISNGQSNGNQSLSQQKMQKTDYYYSFLQERLSGLAHFQEAMARQQISTVLLLREDEEDATTVASIPSNTSIFPCRPEDPSSCQAVAGMLWRRLELGCSSAASFLL